MICLEMKGDLFKRKKRIKIKRERKRKRTKIKGEPRGQKAESLLMSHDGTNYRFPNLSRHPPKMYM